MYIEQFWENVLVCWLSLVAIFGYSINWMYIGFGIVLYAAVMLPKFFFC